MYDFFDAPQRDESVEYGFRAVKEIAECNQNEFTSVIGFFKLRMQLEVAYYKGLERLTKHRQNAEQCEFTTSSHAFTEMVRSSEKAAKHHQKFINTLENLVIEPLAQAKEYQQTHLNNLKIRVKRVTKEYSDLRAQCFPKLKRNYVTKCKEYHERPMEEEDDAIDFTRSFQNNKTTKFLLRQSKARKDMELADEDYRRGVQSLEDVRQKHMEMMKVANQECRRLEYLRVEVIKSSLNIFQQSEFALHEKVKVLSENINMFISCIKPSIDVELSTATFMTGKSFSPEPVYYENYHAGTTKELVFGIPLHDHCSKKERTIPYIVEKCITMIESQGLEKEGLYRISGQKAQIDKLHHAFEQDETIDLDVDINITALTSLLKSYFLKLPHPLFPFPSQRRLEYSKIKEESIRLETLQQELKLLPLPHYDTLQYLVKHLSRIVQHSHLNKMTPYNLSLIFTPVIFQDSPETKRTSSIYEWQYDNVLEYMITNQAEVFDAALCTRLSRPLVKSKTTDKVGNVFRLFPGYSI
ncbi:hypothetical protein K7432_014043 [Basidiobolus ranarum]|uniref:Rho-GAP domain-containing protein n=1 Tax=Basidiobolus ranarum TaxID=34480 RepID=A0ABR2VQX0_9FUNG